MSSNGGRNYRGELGPYDWDWTPLNNSFPRGIRMGDIDGFVEINWHFLTVEAKSLNASLPRGQHQALWRKSQQPKNTVAVITGKPPDTITGWEVWGELAKELETTTYEGDYKDFVGFMSLWPMHAEKTNHN